MWERICDCCGVKFGTPTAYEKHLENCSKTGEQLVTGMVDEGSSVSTSQEAATVSENSMADILAEVKQHKAGESAGFTEEELTERAYQSPQAMRCAENEGRVSMEITCYENKEKRVHHINITISESFIIDQCEPYGNYQLCSLISTEQAIGIITDAVLMGMKLKLKKETNQ